MHLLRSLAAFALASLGAAEFLFHGSSIVIYPSAVSVHPKDSEFDANFFSYVTPKGYFSFRWWLDPKDLDTSRCIPKPPVECRVHAVNYLVKDPAKPSIDSDYVATALDLGNGDVGHLALSYFDKPMGGYAVGSRNVLSGDDVDSQAAQDCHDAFETLTNIQSRWNVKPPFELENPCSKESASKFGFLFDL